MAQRSRQGLMTGVLLAAVAALLLPGHGAAAASPLPAGRTWIVLDGRQTCAVSGWLGADRCSAASGGGLTLKKPAGGAYTTWRLEAAPGHCAPAPGADLSGLRVTLRLEGRAGAPYESCASYLAPASATSCANTGVTLSATPGVWVLEAVNGDSGRYRLRANARPVSCPRFLGAVKGSTDGRTTFCPAANVGLYTAANATADTQAPAAPLPSPANPSCSAASQALAPTASQALASTASQALTAPAKALASLAFSPSSQPLPAPAQPFSTSASTKPLSASSQALSATAQPVSASAQPFAAPAQPFSTSASAHPFPASAKPLSASSQPLSASAQPLAAPTAFCNLCHTDVSLDFLYLSQTPLVAQPVVGFSDGGTFSGLFYNSTTSSWEQPPGMVPVSASEVTTTSLTTTPVAAFVFKNDTSGSAVVRTYGSGVWLDTFLPAGSISSVISMSASAVKDNNISIAFTD
ncbi:hypothetical protein ABPG77_007203, partial [Micractinium sp. CCAP 211/92]